MAFPLKKTVSSQKGPLLGGLASLMKLKASFGKSSSTQRSPLIGGKAALEKLHESFKILSFLELQLKKIWKGYVVKKKTGGYNVLLEDLLYEIFIYDNNYNLSEKDIVNVKINGIKWHQLEVKAIIVV